MKCLNKRNSVQLTYGQTRIQYENFNKINSVQLTYGQTRIQYEVFEQKK